MIDLSNATPADIDALIGRRLKIVSVGQTLQPGADCIGGDTRLGKLGYKAELIDMRGDPEDGGPIALCICPDIATAARIRNALELVARL